MIKIEYLSKGVWSELYGHACYTEDDAKRYVNMCPYMFRYSVNGGEFVGPTGTAPTPAEIKLMIDKTLVNKKMVQSIIDRLKSFNKS